MSRATIVPAIIPESLEHFGRTLDSVQKFTGEVQIDLVDGRFVPFTSWPYVGGGEPSDIAPFTKKVRIELDLMILHPEEVIPSYVAAGIGDIIVHLESNPDFERILELKQSLVFRLGISMNNDSPLSHIEDYIAHADYVQFMGIAHIGSQGQPFDERVLSHIVELRKKYPDMPVSVDGSVNADTIPRLRDAGVTRFVSGSAILGAADPEAAYHRLEELAN